MKKIFNAILYTLLPLTVMAADPAEGHEAEIPAWVNAGAERFEGTAAMKPYLQGQDPFEHSGELAKQAKNILKSFTNSLNEAGHFEPVEKLSDVQSKIDHLNHSHEFNWVAYASMHFYLASVASPADTQIESIISPVRGFVGAWEKLSDSDDFCLNFNHNLRETLSMIQGEYNLSDEAMLKSIMLPMYASSAHESDLGIKTLLQKSLEGFVPFILTPTSDDVSIHGGIVRSPLDIIAHDFAHGAAIQALKERLNEGEALVRGLRAHVLAESGATIQSRKELIKAFVLAHEFPANITFATPDELANYDEGDSLYADTDSYVAQNIAKIGDYSSDLTDEELKRAANQGLDAELKRLPGGWNLEKLNSVLQGRETDLFEIDLAGNIKHISAEKVSHQEALGRYQEGGLQTGKTWVLVDFKDSPSMKSNLVEIFSDAKEKGTSVTVINRSYFKVGHVQRNFQDYGKLLQMAHIVPTDRDLSTNPLSGDEIVAGLIELMN